MKKGFTLIELLIVVAIIAILAAIAIPNFLQAQTRAKVSRVNSDLRTVATALESYYVDYNAYPAHVYGGWSYGFYFLGSDVFGWVTPEERPYPIVNLTTPISYITTISTDPFAPDPQGIGGSFNYPYRYVYSHTDIYEGNDWQQMEPSLGQWILWSVGPDGTSWGGLFNPMFNVATSNTFDTTAFNRGIYDPTNGTASAGDIYRSQARPDGGAVPQN